MNIEDIVSKYTSEFIFFRIIAYLIDILFISFFSIIILLILSIIIGDFNVFYWTIGLLVIYQLYFIILEALSGYTLGKLILQIKVVDVNGNIPGFSKSTIRNITRFIELNPIIILGIISIIIIFSSNINQRLGDKMAGTLIIKHKDLTDFLEIDKKNEPSYFNFYEDSSITESNKPFKYFLLVINLIIKNG